jgi:hypothetical protein
LEKEADVIREQEIPTCPQCKSNDRVVRIRGAVADDLAGYFCDRCCSNLAALPAPSPGSTVPVKIGERIFDTIEPQPTGQKPKRGRKPKEAGDDAE